MKKLIVFLFSVALLTGCTPTTNSSELSVLCPTGAPALAFVDQYQEIVQNGTFDLVDGSDQLIAELSKTDSKYDVIVAPINTGTSLMTKDQTDYKLAAVVTWGNLYLVGTNKDALNSTGEIALFGNGTVPQKIYDTASIETTLTPNYYQSATLVQQQLLSGNVAVGMLAEPLASATIASAKNSGIELEIITDMQVAYGGNGYPQAAIFVKENSNYKDFIDTAHTFTTEGFPKMEAWLTTITADTLKLPSVEITMTSLERQNIKVEYATDVKQEIADFLQLFNIEFNDDMLIK